VLDDPDLNNLLRAARAVRAGDDGEHVEACPLRDAEARRSVHEIWVGCDHECVFSDLPNGFVWVAWFPVVVHDSLPSANIIAAILGPKVWTKL